MQQVFTHANAPVQRACQAQSIVRSWAPACTLALGAELNDMLRVPGAFSYQLCQLRRSAMPDIFFREVSEWPWLDMWWFFKVLQVPAGLHAPPVVAA